VLTSVDKMLAALVAPVITLLVMRGVLPEAEMEHWSAITSALVGAVAVYFVPNKVKDTVTKLDSHWLGSVLALLLLAGCAGAEAKTPAQRVFGIKSDYKEVVRIALIYESLPRCSGFEEQLADEISWSRPDVVEVIRNADLSTDKALNEAEVVVRNPSANRDTLKLAVKTSEAALATFQSVLKIWGITEEDMRSL